MTPRTEMLAKRKKAAMHSRQISISSDSHIRRNRGLHSFIQPPEVTTKDAPRQHPISDSILGKHTEPHGTLRLRASGGKYLGVVGKRRKFVRRLKEWMESFKAGYKPTQVRDSHGRWTSGLAGGGPLLRALRFGMNRRQTLRDYFTFNPHGGPAKMIPEHIGKPFPWNKTDHATRRAMQEGARAIDSVLRLPKSAMRTLGKRGLVAKFVDTNTWFGEYDPRINNINIQKTLARGATETFVHEVGHLLDHTALSNRRLDVWEHLGDFLPDGSPAMRRFDMLDSPTDAAKVWWRAVRESPPYKFMTAAEKTGKMLTRMGRKVSAESFSFSSYLLTPTEMWSRAFTQYIAHKSGSPSLLRAIRKGAHATIPMYWKPEDFGGISHAMDRIFTEKGLLLPPGAKETALTELVFKAYAEVQHPRDDHGRWAAVGGALNKLVHTRLRPKVQGAPAGIYHQALKPLNPLARGAAHIAVRVIQHKLNPPRLIDIVDDASSAYAARLRAQYRFKAGYSGAEARDAHGRWTAGAVLANPKVVAFRKKIRPIAKPTATATILTLAAAYSRSKYKTWKWRRDYARDAKKWGDGFREWMKATGNYFSEDEALLAFNQFPGSGEYPSRPGIHAYRWPQYPNWQVFGGLLPPAGKELRFKAGYRPTEARDSHGRWTNGGIGDIILHGGAHHHISDVANALSTTRAEGLRPVFTGHLSVADHLVSKAFGTASGLYHGSRNEIEISIKADYPGLTTAHEIAHALDHKGFGSDWASEQVFGPLDGWRHATFDSKAYSELAKYKRNGGVFEHNGQRYRADEKYFRYMMQPRELWARSFAQWHVLHSNNRGLRRELVFAQKQSLPYYWSHKDFAPIDREITKVMRKYGYTK